MPRTHDNVARTCTHPQRKRRRERALERLLAADSVTDRPDKQEPYDPEFTAGQVKILKEKLRRH